MPEFSGSALYGTWVYSGGTVVLSGNQRTCTISPTVDYIDTTAGSDARKTRLASLKDITASWSMLYQVGGTALEDALAEGTQGTLNVYPEGTATGKRQHIIGAFSNGPKVDHPYADVVIMTVDFTGNGNYSRTTA